MNAQAVPGLFELERPSSFVAIAVGTRDRGAPTMDWPTYLARYQHVKTTLSGAVVGAIAGAGMVFVVCGRAENEGSFLGEASCINRDRWFGFVAGGSLIGTVIGGALGASSTGGILGPIGPLRASDCTFREGMRRSLIGAALGSLPAIAVFADGSGALESSFLAPVLQGGGALIATWSCFDAPRLGPIGQPPVPRPR